MKKILQIFLLVAMYVYFPLNAQSMKYEYSTSSAAFNAVSGGTQIALTGTLDEGYSAPIPFGFTFNYNGVAYDSFQVSTNGFVRLGQGLTSATATNALGGTVRQIVAPLWDDLKLADTTSLNYSVSGSTPNRILTVEWINAFWSFSAASANARFQIRFYEGSNKIEFHYGQFGTVAATVNASVGLSDHTAITSTDLAMGTFLSFQFNGDALSRNVMATMGLEFKTVFLAPDSGFVISMTPAGAPLNGAYTVGGTSPDFTTLSQAAIALSSRGVGGSVQFNVRAGTYEDVLHIYNFSGASSSNSVTVKNESGAVTLSPKNGGRTSSTVTAADAVIRLDGARWVTLDGINIIENAANNSTALKFEMGIVLANSVAGSTVTGGSRYNVIKNLSIDMNATNGAANNNSIAIRFGTAGSNTDTAHTNSYNTIQDLVISDYWRAAVFAYGFSGAIPDRGNKITAVTGRNTFGNVFITSGTALDSRTIELNAQFDFTIEKTDIKDVIVQNIFTTNGAYGIRMNPAAGADHNGGTILIQDVNISNIELQSTTVTTGIAMGIEVNRVAANTHLIIRNCSVSDIYSNASTTGRACGILVSVSPQTGNSATADIYNNLVYDLRAPRATTAPSVRGIDLQSSSGNLLANVRYNTVYLDDAVPPTVTTHQSSGIYWANYGTSTLTLQNNVVVNLMNSGTRAVALYPSANSNMLRLSPATNNNLYYAGAPGATKLIAYDGATAYDSLYKYKNAVATGGLGGPREVLSVTENPPFVSAVSPYNLNMQTTVATQAESGGQPVAGITTDYAGNIRNSNFPDIGAYEFAGIAIDNNPPLIAYAPLGNTHFTTNRTMVSAITDPSGVASAGNAPRLYYRKSVNDSYVFTSGTASGNDYTFTFDYSLLPGGSIAIGDTISYYVAAQDANGISVTNPSGGSGNNPPGTVAPTSPRTFMVLGAPLNGVYTISAPTFNSISGRTVESRIFEKVVEGPAPKAMLEAGLVDKNGNPIELTQEENHIEQYEVLYENGQPFRGSRVLNGNALNQAKANGLLASNIEAVYPSLSAAVTDLNLRGLSGHVTFLLADTAYSTSTLTLQITYDSLPSNDRTIVFKPAAGVTTTITAASTSPVFIIANSYVRIEGSNGTEDARNMIIQNTTTGASAGAVFFSTADFCGIRDVVAKAKSMVDGYGIVFSSSKFGKIVNNLVTQTALGIQLQGSSDGCLIADNEVMGGPDSLSKIQNAGIVVLSSKDFVIRNNMISSLKRYSTSYVSGILIGISSGGADVKDGIIHNNKIWDVKHLGVATTGYASNGIKLLGNLTNSNIRVYNNVITDILGGGDAGITYSPSGINVTQGGGYEIYFNSVNMFGEVAYSGTSAAASAALLVNTAASANLNIRNNILSNSQTYVGTLGKTYSFYSTGTSASFTDINYNDYWSVGADSGFNFLGASAYGTLAAWQAATTKDANSKAVSPMYTDTMNLRPLAGSGIIFAGTTIPGITHDFTNALRTNTPSMGAFEFPLANIGWANLQWPGNVTVPFGGSTTVYGQIWADGITNTPGASVGLIAWLGHSNSNTDPSTWTNWIPAVFNVDVGNNDEFKADIGAALPAGTHYYAYRYQLYGGNYYYGGYSQGGGGPWNGTSNVSGVLNVQDPPLIINWQMSAAASTLPTWFSATGSTERGFGYGKVNTPTDGVANRLVVVSRNGGSAVRLVDDSTGADAGTLDVTGITGGLFVINDADVSYKGHIYVCNMTTDATNPANPFKVYRWLNTASLPELVISFNTAAAIRLGDKFKVSWDAATNGVVVWAASSTSGQPLVYKWMQIAGTDSFNQTPTIITLENNPAVGASAAVGPLPDGSFYWNSNGQLAKKYQANGTLIDTIPGTVLASGSNAMEFIGTVGTSEYLAVFQYGTGNNNARVLEIPNNNPELATTYGITPSLGPNSNSNGTGDVAVKHNANGSKTVFALGTNNGFGSYFATQSIPVQLASFTANLQGSDVTLNWQTATETNSSTFEVERSYNNVWEGIGSVKAAGTSTELKNYSFTDQNLSGGKYSYRLKVVDLDGTFEYSNSIEVDVNIPLEYSLSQNFPNPFNPNTTVKFALPFESRVTVQVFAVTGELVETIYNGQLGIGYHQFDWNASRFASGMYIYRMSAQSLVNDKSFNSVKKMMLLK